MELLPSSHEDFASKSYWESFFSKRGQSFEWYGGYDRLAETLHQYIKPSDSILMVGCGNSDLSECMYDVGMANIINIDISQVVIENMMKKHKVRRPDMKFMIEDVTKLSFEDSCFSSVVDKGTLDALAPNAEPKTQSTVEAMFDEIYRTLKPFGKYICVTLAQGHVLNMIVEYFSKRCAIVRVHQLPEELREGRERGRIFHMPAFVLIITKLKEIPGLAATVCYETAYFDSKPQRCSGLDEFVASIKEIQYYGILRHKLSEGTLDKHYTLTLHVASNPEPRYRISVVDNPAIEGARMNAAVFIVPRGREFEWIFHTPEGNVQLCQRTHCQGAPCHRLIVAKLSRSHKYLGQKQIQDELSSKVLELAPHRRKDKRVAFLSVCENFVGNAVVVAEGTWGKKEDGETFLVEEVEVDELCTKQLVLFRGDSVHIDRTELRQISSKKRSYKAADRTKIDSYHRNALKALAFMKKPVATSCSVLIIGLGAGVFPQYLTNAYKKMTVTVVEPSSTIIQVAKTQFGCTLSKQLAFEQETGLSFVDRVSKESPDSRYDAIIFQAPFLSEDPSARPPSAVHYLGDHFLGQVRCLLTEHGVFICSLPPQLTVDIEAKERASVAIKRVFPYVCRADFNLGMPTVVVGSEYPMVMSSNQNPGISSNGAGEKVDIPKLASDFDSMNTDEAEAGEPVYVYPPLIKKNVEAIIALLAKSGVTAEYDFRPV